MSERKENAKIGSETERYFISLLKTNPEIISIINTHYQIKGSFIEAHATGSNLKKSDVLLLFAGNYSLGVNIKAGKTNFNQVTRLWLDRFIQEVPIDRFVSQAIQNGIDNHRLKRSPIFINPEYHSILKRAFIDNIDKIMNLIFKGGNNDIVKILALYNRYAKSFNIYDMDDAIRILSEYPITFSSKGIIKFGEYITMQRKGGNGVSVGRLKSDPMHPGNQIQFKMKILSFMTNHRPLVRFNKNGCF